MANVMNPLFMVAQEPPKSPLIDFVTETKIEIIVPPELTVEEKIASNYYKCDESRQYIRLDTAECLDRPQYRASEARSTTERTNTPVSTQNTSTAPSGWYEAGSCTYGAQQLAPWVGRWKNANTWDDMARADGHIVSSIPIVGAVFVDNGGRYGHVGVVIVVDGRTITVKDMNYRNKWEWTIRTVDASEYVYIYP